MAIAISRWFDDRAKSFIREIGHPATFDTVWISTLSGAR